MATIPPDGLMIPVDGGAPADFRVFDGSWHQEVDVASMLSRKKLFKLLSLFEANRCSVQVPSTWIMLACELPAIERVFQKLGSPVMLRMDFAQLPARKPLGGIPLFTPLAAYEASAALTRLGLCPFFHPHLDRADDLYSVGVVLKQGRDDVLVEVVGQGFDAGDLRLGMTKPHEQIRLNLASDEVTERAIIAADDYAQSRAERLRRIAAFEAYIADVNTNFTFHSNLDAYLASNLPAPRNARVSEKFRPLGRAEIKSVARLSWNILNCVLPKLPHSEEFVASFSLVPNRGWLLWDVFGRWYHR
jgi:hypothetical protein